MPLLIILDEMLAICHTFKASRKVYDYIGRMINMRAQTYESPMPRYFAIFTSMHTIIATLNHGRLEKA